jgi:UDP-2-acetamido-2-deoxy-ribo-hexuluronate aminotransferase
MSGNYTAEFENWLAQRNHSKYAITCHSGSQALEIIAEYYRQQSPAHPPRAVIPAMTYVATANAFVRAGWEVYIADTDAHGLIDMKKIPSDLSVQATVLVGLYGHSVEQFGERFWATDLVIEDGAQSFGAIHNGKRSCNLSLISTTSFFPSKPLGCYGDGGACFTNDIKLADKMRAIRAHVE